MLNYIWAFMIIFSFIVSIFNGRLEATSEALIFGANEAITLIIKLLGVMCLWSGIMKIAEKIGFVNVISNFTKPLLSFLFPRLKNNAKIMGLISINIAANLLGLGSAATPLGLKAISAMQEINPRKKIATNEMCTLIVLNTASIQFIPSSLLAIRSSFESQNPFEIVFPIWIVSIITIIVGLTVTRILERVTL